MWASPITSDDSVNPVKHRDIYALPLTAMECFHKHSWIWIWNNTL